MSHLQGWPGRPGRLGRRLPRLHQTHVRALRLILHLLLRDRSGLLLTHLQGWLYSLRHKCLPPPHMSSLSLPPCRHEYQWPIAQDHALMLILLCLQVKSPSLQDMSLPPNLPHSRQLRQWDLPVYAVHTACPQPRPRTSPSYAKRCLF